jgi:peptide/nickel transport system substrate-binding protein
VLVPAKKAEKGYVLLREALEKTRDQYYYVPLHHQLRPWAMKKGVTPVYDILDRPNARFTVVK